MIFRYSSFGLCCNTDAFSYRFYCRGVTGQGEERGDDEEVNFSITIFTGLFD